MSTKNEASVKNLLVGRSIYSIGISSSKHRGRSIDVSLKSSHAVGSPLVETESKCFPAMCQLEHEKHCMRRKRAMIQAMRSRSNVRIQFRYDIRDKDWEFIQSI